MDLTYHCTRLIYGAGGHGKVILDAASCAGIAFDLILEDGVGGFKLLGVPVASRHSYPTGISGDFEFVIGIGNNLIRKAKYVEMRSLGGLPIAVVHPTATVSTHADIGDGSVVFAHSVLNPGCSVGENAVINTSATVDHDCIVEDHAQLCPGVHLSGAVVVGTGTSVADRNRIGAGTVVRKGSVITQSIPDGVLAYGTRSSDSGA